ncbi:hypothetical protein ABE504_09005 [Paenibacillus oryzisoli]|uniref:hypothetical protein n=1 Tax=Paenibacillus oryzisoli TaxID=1850517 RepID=UPI003D288AF3
MRSFLEAIDEMKNPWICAIIYAAAAAISYYAYTLISELPKPETFSELVKFYFASPLHYLKITCISFGAFLLCGFAAIVSFRLSYVGDESALWVRVLLCVAGALFVIASLYFLVYFSWLLIVLCVLGFILVAMGNSDSRPRRRRAY